MLSSLIAILVSLYDKFTVNLYIKAHREKKLFKQIKIVTLFAMHNTNMGGFSVEKYTFSMATPSHMLRKLFKKQLGLKIQWLFMDC